MSKLHSGQLWSRGVQLGRIRWYRCAVSCMGSLVGRLVCTLNRGRVPGAAAGDPRGSVLDRVPRQMRVPRGGLNLRVAQQLPDHREALAEGQRPRSIRVPERGGATRQDGACHLREPRREGGSGAGVSPDRRQRGSRPAGLRPVRFPAGVRAEGGEFRRPATGGLDGAACRALAPASGPAQPRIRSRPAQDRWAGAAAVIFRGGKTKGPRKVQDPSVDREIPNPLIGHITTAGNFRKRSRPGRCGDPPEPSR